MKRTNTMDFEDIRPYEGKEVKEALDRIGKDPRFHQAMATLFPEVSAEEWQKTLEKDQSTYDFQRDFMHKGIRRIVERFSDGLSYDGFQYLEADQPYLFIANHRDIFLDSGFLEILLFEHGLDTTEISLGSNLIMDSFLEDVGKVNKMYTVYREGSGRERYENSKRLSEYIRHTITEKRNSLWIAQRNGRAKDGNDRTHPAVLKMLNSSGKGDFEENFRELNLIPLTVSYEFEPCDKYKVRELYQTEVLGQEYVKEKGEDFKSILEGVIEPKGRIHLSVGMPLSEELPALQGIESDNKRFEELASILDSSIIDNYKLWPSHYIAYDEWKGGKKFVDEYDDKALKAFHARMERVLSELDGDRDALRDLFLRLYANPVRNSLGL